MNCEELTLQQETLSNLTETVFGGILGFSFSASGGGTDGAGAGGGGGVPPTP